MFYPVYPGGLGFQRFLTCQQANQHVNLGVVNPCGLKSIVDDRLKELAEARYQRREFLQTLFELAVENQWFDVRHMVQHDMAKAIIADYSLEQGRGYLDQELYFDNWESVVEVGWTAFCTHTGLSMDRVNNHLQQLNEL